MFRVVPFAFSVEKVRQLEKSTPAVLVALVTNYSYDHGITMSLYIACNTHRLNINASNCTKTNTGVHLHVNHIYDINQIVLDIALQWCSKSTPFQCTGRRAFQIPQISNPNETRMPRKDLLSTFHKSEVSTFNRYILMWPHNNFSGVSNISYSTAAAVQCQCEILAPYVLNFFVL